MGTGGEEARKVPEVTVELKQVKHLREEIRKDFSLGEDGLAFKIITHASPYKTVYEKIKDGFFVTAEALLQGADLAPFVKKLRI